jgi:hypothetical protein
MAGWFADWLATEGSWPGGKPVKATPVIIGGRLSVLRQPRRKAMKPEQNEVWVANAGTEVIVRNLEQGKVTYQYVKESDQHSNNDQRMTVNAFVGYFTKKVK